MNRWKQRAMVGQNRELHPKGKGMQNEISMRKREGHKTLRTYILSSGQQYIGGKRCEADCGGIMRTTYAMRAITIKNTIFVCQNMAKRKSGADSSKGKKACHTQFAFN